MPLFYERSFRIRHYECDAHGQVKHANFARFMQETALDASAAVGYDIAKYEAMQRLWLIRETNLKLQRPLTYGTTILVKTWVEDFRRVRSRRAYQFSLAESGEPVAEAHTDWIFIDTERERPVTVPPEMITAFIPEGISEQAPRREKFPDFPAQPPQIFSTQRLIPWQDIDGAGHLNNAMYVSYIQDCAVQASTQFGWPPDRFLTCKQGFLATQYRIEYLQPAFLGDEVACATFLSELKGATAVRHFSLTRVPDKTLLARAQVKFSWVNLANGQIMEIPQNFVNDLEANISTQAN